MNAGALQLFITLSAALGGLLCVLLLAGGIGLLMSKDWGRRISRTSALVLVIIGATETVLFFVAAFLFDGTNSGGELFGIGIYLAFKVIVLIYPVTLISYMDKPELKAALNKE